MSVEEVATALFALCSVRSGSPELAASPSVDQRDPSSGRKRGSDIERAQLSDYRIYERIGSGNDAVVYRATEKATLRVVALKAMPKAGRSRTAVSRFRMEGQLLTDVIGPHPHVCRAFSWFETASAVTIVLECVSGGSLHSFVNDVGRPLAERELRSVLEQLAGALSFVHSKGYVHHDVKPENVLVAPADGELSVKLCDWSYACRIGDGAAPGRRAGSFAYTCPEVFAAADDPAPPGADVAATRPPVDVWSLGVTLYAISFKILPFGAKESNIRNRRFVTSQSELWPSRSFDFHALVDSMLRVEADKRITLDRVREHPWFIQTALR